MLRVKNEGQGTHCPSVHRKRKTRESNYAPARKFNKRTSLKINSKLLNTSHIQPMKFGISNDPLVVKRLLAPLYIEKIRRPVIVKKICTPIYIKRIKRPITISAIQSPVMIKGIESQISIRPLNQKLDKVTVYGSNPTAPVHTDDDGRIVLSGEIHVSPIVYTEKTFMSLDSQDQVQSIPAQNVSRQTNLSYAIVNRSENPVNIFLEISPNDIDYVLDSEITVSGLTTQALTPLRFLRYAKISYQSAKCDHPAVFDVYYQAQSG